MAQVCKQTFISQCIRDYNASVKLAQSSLSFALLYHALDISLAHIRCYTDGLFSSNTNLASQIGFLVLLCDTSGNCHILDYRSCKSRRIVRSVLSAELFAFVEAFDAAYT